MLMAILCIVRSPLAEVGGISKSFRMLLSVGFERAHAYGDVCKDEALLHSGRQGFLQARRES